ncbi:RecQ family ATP-dependent DNA helicase [bacterium]|nr:RecQ family ATP-dependent DNA helicase [bacterium]
MNIQEILESRWGHKTFRGEQQKIIEQILQKQNALVVMPTGSGKSLCFQIPSVIFKGLTLVVSPLIALMKDQVDDALSKNLKVAAIHSGMSKEEREKVLKKLSAKSLQLIYVTPERFRKEDFWQALSANTIDLLVVDEAHCISEWGHDFRPDYSRLGEIRQKLGEPCTLALTATATKEVQTDILKQLHIESTAQVFDAGAKRENLVLKTYPVYGLEEKIRAFVGLHHQNPGAQIVYFSLISTLEKFSRELQKLNVAHGVYHGQLPDNIRRRQQEDFLKNSSGLILATPAFGLGINKPDIRLVVHAEIPGSVEAYYQEVGRAGRDGKTAHGALLYDEDDVAIQMDFLKWASPEPEFILRVYRLLETHKDQVRAGGLDYLRGQLLFYHQRDFRLETALNQLERYGFIEGRDAKNWRCVEDPSGELVDTELHSKRLRQQQKKLLQMIELTKLEDPRPLIEEYFSK